MAHFEFHPGAITASAKRLISSFDSAFDKFNIFYSVKTNWHPLVVREIQAVGGYFEVTSLMEWRKVAGLNPLRAIVNGPAKSISFVSEVVSSGVHDLILNLDNDTDLERVPLFVSLSPRVRLGLRVFLDREDVWTRFGYNADAVLSNPATRDVLSVLRGFHFHFSTRNYSIDNYRAIARAIVASAKESAASIEFIDIGGGVPCSEDVTDEDLNTLARTLREFFGPQIEIISETGRFLAESAMSLVAEIVSVKQLGVQRYDVAIDTNVCHLPCYWQKAYAIEFLPTVRQPAQLVSLGVFGNSCMQLDCFAKDFIVTQAPRPGDLLKFSRMGAYSLSQAAPFITDVPEVTLT
jgi:diaminopimelate decarboxylase